MLGSLVCTTLPGFPLGCVGFLSGREEAGKYSVLERVEQGSDEVSQCHYSDLET